MEKAVEKSVDKDVEDQGHLPENEVEGYSQNIGAVIHSVDLETQVQTHSGDTGNKWGCSVNGDAQGHSVDTGVVER